MPLFKKSSSEQQKQQENRLRQAFSRSKSSNCLDSSTESEQSLESDMSASRRSRSTGRRGRSSSRSKPDDEGMKDLYSKAAMKAFNKEQKERAKEQKKNAAKKLAASDPLAVNPKNKKKETRQRIKAERMIIKTETAAVQQRVKAERALMKMENAAAKKESRELTRSVTPSKSRRGGFSRKISSRSVQSGRDAEQEYQQPPFGFEEVSHVATPTKSRLSRKSSITSLVSRREIEYDQPQNGFIDSGPHIFDLPVLS